MGKTLEIWPSRHPTGPQGLLLELYPRHPMAREEMVVPADRWIDAGERCSSIFMERIIFSGELT